MIHPFHENFRIVDHQCDLDHWKRYGWEYRGFYETSLEERNLKRGEFFDISKEMAKSIISEEDWRYFKLHKRRMNYKLKNHEKI
jgi:hypothetical protein